MSRSDNPRDTMREVLRDANKDMGRLFRDLNRSLKSATPKDTGRARRGWRVTGRTDILGTEASTKVIANDVEYVKYLNQGHSSQASDGYIGDVINRIFGN